ncbi:MAG: hypothetical protein B7Z53_02875 [Rhodospirillales bacterium 12-71-4]|nr:MAG: hypothetical protein B7Z53_02875 [Rhodospirillales bacterium 12-71-4]
MVLETVWSTGTALTGLAPVKEWAAGLRARAAGRLALPVNHTLVRTIRTGHLTAIDKITRRHADLLLDLPKQAGNADEAAFNLLRDDTDFAAVTEAEVQHVLDEMVHPSAIEGYAEAAATNRRQAETRALAELEAHAGFPEPPLYRRLFIGEAAPGWFETFGLFVNEQIKSNEAFRSIFLAAELVDVKRLIVAMDARIAAALMRGVHRLERVETKIDAVKDETSLIKSMLEQVLATLRTNESERAALLEQIESLRATQRLSAETTAGFLRDIGAKDVAPSDYPATMARMAERFRDLLAEAERRTNLPAALEDARLRAAEAIRRGDLDVADSLLRRIELRLAEQRHEQQEAFQQSCRDEASLKVERAGIAMTRLRYREAATLHEDSASLLAFDTEAAWRALMAAADALYDQGREFGDNAALAEAIATYRRAAGPARRDRVPLDWAKTQNNLGNALRRLGERERGTERLEEAVAAYRLALEEHTRDRVPLDWAGTQNNLGLTFWRLGERESGTARLEEAVAAYRLALEERTRDRVPLDWATTQNNLGTALALLGARERGTARLEEAMVAYRLVLEERTRARVPFLWAQTKENLALTEDSLGEREASRERWSAALHHVEDALEEYRRAGASYFIDKATVLRDHLLARLAASPD